MENKKISHSNMCIDWESFYKEHFNIAVDFSRVPIPDCSSKDYRLIVIPKGMNLNKVFSIWPLTVFGSRPYGKKSNFDFDMLVPFHARTAKRHYAIWTLHSSEAVEFKGQSTMQADPGMQLGMTLLERAILELKYHSETGGNILDIRGLTLCSGSRDKKGDVPCVHGFYEEDAKKIVTGVCVFGYKLDESDPNGGIRKVITD